MARSFDWFRNIPWGFTGRRRPRRVGRRVKKLARREIELLEDRSLLATTTFSLGPSAGAIPIATFTAPAGNWVTNVNLQVNLQGGGTNSGPSHVHSVGYLPYGGGTTFASPGGHAHSVSLPSFSGGGLTIPGFSFSTSGASNSGHSISPYSTTTNPGGTSPHSFSSQVRSYNFSGGGTAPFLGGSNFSIPTGSTGTTEDDGVHFHGDSRNGSNTGSGGGHSHSYPLAWSTQTTFTYEPNVAGLLQMLDRRTLRRSPLQ